MGESLVTDEAGVRKAIEERPYDRFLHKLMADIMEDQGENDLADAWRWLAGVTLSTCTVDRATCYYWPINQVPYRIRARMIFDDFKWFKTAALAQKAVVLALDRWRQEK